MFEGAGQGVRALGLAGELFDGMGDLWFPVNPKLHA